MHLVYKVIITRWKFKVTHENGSWRKAYPCAQCKNIFTCDEHLKQPLGSHAGEIFFACIQCTKKRHNSTSIMKLFYTASFLKNVWAKRTFLSLSDPLCKPQGKSYKPLQRCWNQCPASYPCRLIPLIPNLPFTEA